MTTGSDVVRVAVHCPSGASPRDDGDLALSLQVLEGLDTRVEEVRNGGEPEGGWEGVDLIVTFSGDEANWRSVLRALDQADHAGAGVAVILRREHFFQGPELWMTHDNVIATPSADNPEQMRDELAEEIRWRRDARLELSGMVRIGSEIDCGKDYDSRRAISVFGAGMRDFIEDVRQVVASYDECRWLAGEKRPFTMPPSKPQPKNWDEQFRLGRGEMFGSPPSDRVLPRPTLIVGPTGSGKSLAVEWLHGWLVQRGVLSGKSEIQRVNCAGLVPTLVDQEFFGITGGAATDVKAQLGLFLSAWSGLVFLDEINSLCPKGQQTLLHYLDDFMVRPVGVQSKERIFAPAIVVAAAQETIDDQLGLPESDGGFRRDLYHRFYNRIRVPALAERVSDVPRLVDFVLQDPTVNPGRHGRRIVEWYEKGVCERVERWAGAGEFAGNFREMQSLLAHAVRHAARRRRAFLTVADLDAVRPGRGEAA